MKYEKAQVDGKRPYRQRTRARAAERTTEKILDAFEASIAQDHFEQIKLEQVARDAGVTVQTVLRKFGGKDGLLAAAWNRIDARVARNRLAPPVGAEGVVRTIVKDYETVGDLVIRLLAQEERVPELKAVNDQGRAKHREWLARAFADSLDGLPSARRAKRLDVLVAATDLYVWKLVRRDLGRSVRRTCEVMLDLVRGALADPDRTPGGGDGNHG